LDIHHKITLSILPTLDDSRDKPKKRIYAELGEFRRKGDRFTITVLESLPEETLYETLAHELAHAWQAENPVPNQRLIVKEGFAQWVASKVLKEFRFENSLKRLKTRDDLYGEGYRLMESIERKNGPRAVFQFTATSR